MIRKIFVLCILLIAYGTVVNAQTRYLNVNLKSGPNSQQPLTDAQVKTEIESLSENWPPVGSKTHSWPACGGADADAIATAARKHPSLALFYLYTFCRAPQGTNFLTNEVIDPLTGARTSTNPNIILPGNLNLASPGISLYASNTRIGVVMTVKVGTTKQLCQNLVYNLSSNSFTRHSLFASNPAPSPLNNTICGITQDGKVAFEIVNKFPAPPLVYTRMVNAAGAGFGPAHHESPFSSYPDFIAISASMADPQGPAGDFDLAVRGEAPLTSGLTNYLFVLQTNGKAQVINLKNLSTAKSSLTGYEGFNSVAFSSDAQFLLSTQYSPACKKDLLNILEFNPASQAKVGSKVLGNCGSLSSSAIGNYGLTELLIQ